MLKEKKKPYNLTVRVDTALYLELQKAARREKSDISKIVRHILVEQIKGKGVSK